MKNGIVVDSSSDLKADYLDKEKIGFKIIPLVLNVNDKSFIDDKDIDVRKLIDSMLAFKGKSTSSCPSPGEFFDAFMENDVTYCVTISSKLSGSYNSAMVAAKMARDEGKEVYVFDSLVVSGGMVIMVDKLFELISKGLDSKKIVKLMEEQIKSQHLVFILQKFDNLIKNGRMSPLAGVIANILFIRPLCIAENGEIKVLEKIRTSKGAFKRMVNLIGETITDFKERICIITHCFDKEQAIIVKNMVEEKYDFKEVRIMPMRGLSSFYALPKGIILNY